MELVDDGGLLKGAIELAELVKKHFAIDDDAVGAGAGDGAVVGRPHKGVDCGEGAGASQHRLFEWSVFFFFCSLVVSVSFLV